MTKTGRLAPLPGPGKQTTELIALRNRFPELEISEGKYWDETKTPCYFVKNNETGQACEFKKGTDFYVLVNDIEAVFN